MKRQVSALLILSLVVVATFTATAAFAQQPPQLPHSFYGAVELNGKPAPTGIKIEARGAGVEASVTNPLVTTKVGEYGGHGIAEPKLDVLGEVQDGTPIEFYINGIKAECAEPGGSWQSSYPYASGEFTELNLRAQIRVYLPLLLR